MELCTARFSLHAVAELEARRIHDRAPDPGDAWATDYPFEGDLAAIGSLLRATEQNGEQRPFGYYQIRRQSDGLAIGGVGFKGPPDGGVVENGYGLVPSARGHGYATEALVALMQLATGLAVTTIRADTDLDNVASQRTLGGVKSKWPRRGGAGSSDRRNARGVRESRWFTVGLVRRRRRGSGSSSLD
jgi:RimJ/RimL family protein N-acetyltransferase